MSNNQFKILNITPVAVYEDKIYEQSIQVQLNNEIISVNDSKILLNQSHIGKVLELDIELVMTNRNISDRTSYKSIIKDNSHLIIDGKVFKVHKDVVLKYSKHKVIYCDPVYFALVSVDGCDNEL